MTWSKRAFDIGFALCVLAVLGPLLVVLILMILVLDGGPVFYVSERMKTADQGFWLWKLRTMKPDDNDFGVTGGDKEDRLTRTGRVLRKLRFDELPQLWNVLRGDISFVGPRPPLRYYVDQYPELYRKVLHSRPGITGLATIKYHKHEERLIAQCQTKEETDRVYQRRCIPTKAKLDLMYQSNANLCFDLVLIWETARGIFKNKRGRR